MSDASPFLPFTHSKLTVDRTLQTFEDYLGWMLRSTNVGYTPDWRKRHNRTQDREPQDTPEDRALWFRQILGTAMAYGMDLPTTSNPDPVELVPAVARWAHGALLHIRGLQLDIVRLHGERLAVDLEHQQKQAASAQQLAELTGRLNRSEETLREANARGDLMAAKVRELHQELREVREQNDRTVDKLQAQIDALASEVKRADSERDAWRMTATATSTALETLRAALRIPAGPVTGSPNVVDAIDPTDIAKTSLVRR